MSGQYQNIKTLLGRTEAIKPEFAPEILLLIEEKLEEALPIQMAKLKDGWQASAGPHITHPTHKGVLVITEVLPGHIEYEAPKVKLPTVDEVDHDSRN